MRAARRVLVVAASLAVAAAPGLAQEAPSTAATTYGPLFGLNYTTVAGADVKQASSRIGIAVGGQVERRFGGHMLFRTGIAFSQRGAEQTGAGTTTLLKLSYIEIPALFGLTFASPGRRVAPFLFGGAQLGFQAGCAIEGSSAGLTASLDCDDPSFGSDMVSTDRSLVGGGGFSVKTERGSWLVDLRYVVGLESIIKASDWKNRGFTFAFTYMVPLKR